MFWKWKLFGKHGPLKIISVQILKLPKCKKKISNVKFVNKCTSLFRPPFRNNLLVRRNKLPCYFGTLPPHFCCLKMCNITAYINSILYSTG